VRVNRIGRCIGRKREAELTDRLRPIFERNEFSLNSIGSVEHLFEHTVLTGEQAKQRRLASSPTAKM
jgi:hypothetical protein